MASRLPAISCLADPKRGDRGMRPEIPPDLAERFKRICPVWAKRIMSNRFNPKMLKKEFTTNGQKWNIGHGNSCIIGEAHRRGTIADDDNITYGCERCVHFSYSLMHVFDSNWITNLRQFLDHYEQKHAMGVPA